MDAPRPAVPTRVDYAQMDAGRLLPMMAAPVHFQVAGLRAWIESFPPRGARRPWHGASPTEMAGLPIALRLAPGGLLGDTLAWLDPNDRAAVLAGVDIAGEGRYRRPDWAGL